MDLCPQTTPLMLLSTDLHEHLDRRAASPMMWTPQTAIRPARPGAGEVVERGHNVATRVVTGWRRPASPSTASRRRTPDSPWSDHPHPWPGNRGHPRSNSAMNRGVPGVVGLLVLRARRSQAAARARQPLSQIDPDHRLVVALVEQQGNATLAGGVEFVETDRQDAALR